MGSRAGLARTVSFSAASSRSIAAPILEIEPIQEIAIEIPQPEPTPPPPPVEVAPKAAAPVQKAAVSDDDDDDFDDLLKNKKKSKSGGALKAILILLLLLILIVCGLFAGVVTGHIRLPENLLEQLLNQQQQ